MKKISIILLILLVSSCDSKNITELKREVGRGCVKHTTWGFYHKTFLNNIKYKEYRYNLDSNSGIEIDVTGTIDLSRKIASAGMENIYKNKLLLKYRRDDNGFWILYDTVAFKPKIDKFTGHILGYDLKEFGDIKYKNPFTYSEMVEKYANKVFFEIIQPVVNSKKLKTKFGKCMAQ
tara:strand:+ start:212 stop:742 length:531 start_codon:yes stop_codon:yes gene_type:complete